MMAWRVDKVRQSAAYVRDECEHAARVLVLTVGAKGVAGVCGGALVRDAIYLGVRMGAAALRADRVARGYFDVETTASGRHGGC